MQINSSLLFSLQQQIHICKPHKDIIFTLYTLPGSGSFFIFLPQDKVDIVLMFSTHFKKREEEEEKETL